MVTKIESSDNRQVPGQSSPVGLALIRGLSVEASLHLAIMAVAVAMRLSALGSFPLLGTEADTALAAWRGAKGQLWRPALYSPLIYDIDLLLFSLGNGSDGLARLLTALSGAALVALPFLARDILGRRGALAAALILAATPSWLYFSRTADGQMLVALATGVALLAWWRQRQQNDGLGSRTMWVALALGLASGAGIYTLLLAVVLGALAIWLRSRRGREDGSESSALRQTLAAHVPRLSREDLLVSAGVLVVAASALGLNPSGIGATVSMAGHWLASLWPGQGALPWYSLLRNLVVYEPLVVGLALLGAVLGLARRDSLEQALVWWSAVALVLGTLLGHRESYWLLSSLLPLSLLAARGFERLCALIAFKLSHFDWAMLWVALCLSALTFLQIAAYIQNGQSDVAWLAGFGFGLLVLSLMAYGFWLGGSAVTRVALVLAFILFAVQGVHTTVSLSYRTGRQAHEALIGETTSPDLARLPDLVKNTSLRLRRDERIASVQYDASLDPLIGWYLRELPNAEPVTYASGLSGADMLITAQRPPEQYPDGYAAQHLVLNTTWPEQTLTLGQKMRWLIYRDDVGASVPTEVQLWIKLTTASSLQP